jgi:hypothetical protein
MNDCPENPVKRRFHLGITGVSASNVGLTWYQYTSAHPENGCFQGLIFAEAGVYAWLIKRRTP